MDTTATPSGLLFRELNRKSCKTYLVACAATRRAALVDPLDEGVDRYLALLAYHHLELELAIDTHTHADHRTGLWDLRDLTGARTVMHERAPAPRIDLHVGDGARLSLGKLLIEVRSTPGHTPDGVSLVLADRVLTGDTLLVHGTGRADFAGGDAGVQYDSIQEKLFTLPEATLVFPAHDYRGHTHSTIGEEKASNPRLAGKSREEYVAVMASLDLPLPDRIQESLQANQCAIEDESVHFPRLAQLAEIDQLAPSEVRARLGQEPAPVLLDVREPEEFTGELGHIPGSRLLPLRELAVRAAELDELRGRNVICICRVGQRSTTAAATLRGLGFRSVGNLKGGMLDWLAAGYPVER